MQASLQLKRDAFRQGIRRAKINQITAEKRLRIIEASESNILEEEVMPKLLHDIEHVMRNRYESVSSIRMLEYMLMLNTQILVNKQVLNYLNFLALRRLDGDITTVEEKKVQGLVSELLYRLLSTRETLACTVMDRIYPILELTDNIEMYCVVSSYQDQSIKSTSYELMLRVLERNELHEQQYEFIAEAFTNYIVKKPQISFTQAAQMLPWFNTRLQRNPQLPSDEFCTYIRTMIEITKEEYQIQLVQSHHNLIQAILNYFRGTTNEYCLCQVLKLLAMIFRGSNELCSEIFNRYRNLFDYLDEKVIQHRDEVTLWCLYAASNMCANGKQIIKDALNSNFITGGVHIYMEGNNSIKSEYLHLLWVMFEKGGDRQRMLIYQNNLLSVIVEELRMNSQTESIVKCLKCLRWLLTSATKMNSLDLRYTSIIKNDLERTPALRSLLEGMVMHHSRQVSSEALVLLKSYLDNTEL